MKHTWRQSLSPITDICYNCEQFEETGWTIFQIVPYSPESVLIVRRKPKETPSIAMVMEDPEYNGWNGAALQRPSPALEVPVLH